jgi:hypothetical protein
MDEHIEHIVSVADAPEPPASAEELWALAAEIRAERPGSCGSLRH